MRILVTGGAGYVGSVLVPMLVARGYDVRVVDYGMFGLEHVPAEAEFADQYIASIRSAVTVGIFQPPDVGMRRRVHNAVMPEDSLWEDQFIGENGTLIEPAVAVGIFE